MATQFTADGFVDSELNVVPKKKPRRRGRPTPREVKHPLMAPALTLADGSLPTPPIPDDFRPLSSSRANEEMPQMLMLEKDREVAAVTRSQLTLTRTQRDVKGVQHQRQNAKLWESVVRSQLSGITAPVRRESDSSGSQSATGYQSGGGEEDSYGSDSMEEGNRDIAPLGRRATFVKEYTYFEDAVQHLDIEGRPELVNENFWS